MAKLLLLTFVLATFGLPTLAARSRSARSGLRRTLLGMLAFEALYLAMLAFLYPV